MTHISKSNLDSSLVIKFDQDRKLEMDETPHVWQIIQIDAHFLQPDGPFPGNSKMQTWLADRFGTGLVIERHGYKHLSPANCPWVYYERGVYVQWPDLVIKFRHEWQKTVFMLQWGQLYITDLTTY